MKTKFTFSFLFILLLSLSSFAQEISFGLESGINFSNINGDLRSGKWDSQKGPVNGFYTKYLFGNWFAVQSGASFVTHYYKHISGNNYYPNPYPTDYYHYLSSSSYALSSDHSYYPYYSNNNWEFNFIRIPLLLKFKTPGKLRFEFGTGPYYSFFVNDEFTGKDKEFYINQYGDNNLLPANDWGWIFSAGLNYSVTDRFDVNLSAQTTKGKEVYIENVEGKNGSTEIILGVGYKLFPSKTKRLSTKIKNDSIGNRVKLLPHSGIILPTAVTSESTETYSNSLGFTAGMSLEFVFQKDLSLISGMWYERKGLGWNSIGEDKIFNYPENSNVQIDLDYLTFPFLMNIKSGKRFITNINFGLYYSLLYNSMAHGDYIKTYSGQNSYSMQKVYIYHKNKWRFKKKHNGGILGVRFEYPVFSETKVFFGINYSCGFINILDNESTDSSSITNQRIVNSSFSMVLGFVFPSNKTETL